MNKRKTFDGFCKIKIAIGLVNLAAAEASKIMRIDAVVSRLAS